MSRARTRVGMTLIELLVALSIGSVVIAAVLAVLTSGQRARDQGEQRSDLFQMVRVVLSQVERDLRVTVTRENDTSFQFVGTNEESSGLPTDSLEFSAASGSPATALLPTSDLIRVRWFIDTDPETPYTGLMREALGLPMPTEVSPEQEELSTRPYCPNAIGLDVTYYDASAQDWVEEWQDRTDLPTAVKVTLYVVQEIPEQGEEIAPGDIMSFSTMARLVLANAPLGTGQATTETGAGTGEAGLPTSGMTTMPGMPNLGGTGGTGGLPTLPGAGEGER
jgi:type II secretion system protein J